MIPIKPKLRLDVMLLELKQVGFYVIVELQICILSHF